MKHPSSLLLCLTGLPLLAGSLRAAPLITEFLTNNNTGILDEDATLQDWIEIHNPDAVEVDLGGYHLTDDAALLQRWTFPAGVIVPPGGYLVVFASGKDRAVAGQNLHTSFSLASGGEYLALTAPGGVPVLTEWAPSYPVQSADVSYGLLTPVSSSASGFFTVPTPGAANNIANSPAETVQFSVPSKTFNQGTTFPVALSTPSGTTTIRYTLNRAMPIEVAGVAPSVTVNATTDEWSAVAHGLKNGDPVQIYSSANSYPTGSGTGITYFVVGATANTFQLSEDPGGTVLDVFSTGSSLHVRRYAAQIISVSATTIIINSHPFYDRDAVQFTSTGTLPSGLTAGVTYYVLNNIAYPTGLNNISVSATPGGAAISLSGGTGTHTIRRIPSPVYSAPITVDHSLRLRARSFEAGRPDGMPVSASYLMLDAAAQSFTSNIPVMILHGFGSGHPSGTAAGAGTPEDTKEDVWFVFEPKPEGTAPNISMVTRLTNTPDMVTPGYFERRGSSTFGAAKYSMTLQTNDEFGKGGDAAPLGFASNDDFVLNAHYDFDRSLMHNDLAYRLSREAGRWAPQTRHVEVLMSVNNDVAAAGGIPAYGVVNGAATSADYYGVFSFQDKISRGANRLNVEKLELTDNTAPNVQGGYIFKIDRLDAGDAGIGAAGRTFALVQPKEWTSYPSHVQVATNAQKTYLSGALNSMYSALTGPSFMSPTLGYSAHLDVPAAIDHWWLSILPKSADAFRLSGYWHKSRYGKLAMGPVFDFDRAMGSTDGRDLNPVTWRGDNGDLGTDYFHSAAIFSPNYFGRMFEDPNYWQATIDRYEELRKTVLSTANVHAIIDGWTELLDPGNAVNTPAKRNGQKWGASAPYRGASASTPGTNGTFRGETQWLKNWWGKAGTVTANGRFDFVDGQFTRPATANLASGPVAMGAALTLTSPSLSVPGTKIYYTTDGTDPRQPATAAAVAPTGLYVAGTAATLATFLPDISIVRAIVPTSLASGGTTGVEWRGADTNSNGNNADDFNDSTWSTNTAGTINGVGYDDDLAVSYLPYISVRWSTAGTPTGNGTMRNVNGSCFSRYAFSLSAANIALANTPGNSIVLNVRYDDGIVVWVNGTRVAFSDNVPSPDSVTWNSVLGTSREATLPAGTDFDITSVVRPLLHEGTNLLAVQSLNGSNTGSSDHLMQPRIEVRGSPSGRPAAIPQLTAGAQEYTGTLNLTSPTRIFARTFIPLMPSDPPTSAGGGTGPVPNGSSWSAPTVLYYFPGAVPASQASIQISEVHYHPTTPSPAEVTAGWTNSNSFEYIRLTNTGAAAVDLTGIHFADGVQFSAAPGLQNWLPAGASVFLVENRAAFESRYGSGFAVLGQYSGDLNDAGERVALNDKAGALISEFTYGDGTGAGDDWPTAPDTDGYSLVYVSGNPGLPESWTVSPLAGGTAKTSFEAWQRSVFTESEIPSEGRDENHDGDALNNLGEYAFVSDPRAAGPVEAAAGQPATGTPPGLSFVRRSHAWDVRWVFETSASVGGPWSPVETLPAATANGDGTETVVWRLPATANPPPRVFMRVRAESVN